MRQHNSDGFARSLDGAGGESTEPQPAAASLLEPIDAFAAFESFDHVVDLAVGILSASGNLWWRVPQVILRQKIEGFDLLTGAMLHRRTNTNSETRFPWVLGRVAYSFEAFDGKHMLAVDGGYQSDKVKNSTGSFS